MEQIADPTDVQEIVTDTLQKEGKIQQGNSRATPEPETMPETSYQIIFYFIFTVLCFALPVSVDYTSLLVLGMSNKIFFTYSAETFHSSKPNAVIPTTTGT